jgi:hydroxysqualene dehydroxylase
VTARTVVVGGGLAGLTAALACAERGSAVRLLERRPRLGGLTASFLRSGPAGDLWVDTGQHVFLRCCTAYRRLLERLGVADGVTMQDRLAIPVARPDKGRRAGPVTAELRRSRLPAPAHLAPTLARYRLLTPADRLRTVRAALALRRVDPDSPATDATSFGDWLASHGQNERTIAALWDLVGVATLNAPAARASLALAAMVFRTGLLEDATAGDVGWSRVPLSRLHGDAARRRLEQLGADVVTNARVTEVRRRGPGWAVTMQDGTEHLAEHVVLAVPPAAAEHLLPAGSLSLPAGWAARLGSSPIVNVHVVYDRRVLDRPFMAAVDSPVQWVFDRTEPACLSGGMSGGAQYVAVSLSAAVDAVTQPSAALQERILTALAELLPGAASARVLDAFVTREPHATFDPAPGQAALRPPPTTAYPGLVLAGAWTDTGWPATMEGAVRSGLAAAAALGADRVLAPTCAPAGGRARVLAPRCAGAAS